MNSKRRCGDIDCVHLGERVGAHEHQPYRPENAQPSPAETGRDLEQTPLDPDLEEETR